MEQVKYLPPKYSHSLKDLATFLGIFEMTEDKVKSLFGDSTSDTSSNVSFGTTRSGAAFRPKNSQLDVIREHGFNKEEEEEDEEELEGMRKINKNIMRLNEDAIELIDDNQNALSYN